MQIKLANNYGFCFGVKRAIEIAQDSKNAATIGPLIHNSEEINRLKKDYNVDTLEDISQINGVSKAIVRTHGITKSDSEFLQKSGVAIIDATCPFVTKPQQICEQMSREGYEIVIFGDKNHPEVKGVQSYALHGAHVVLSVAELKDIKLKQKVAIVSQTTRKAEEFLKVVNHLILQHKEVRVFNTICNATFENQDAVRELAQEADVMVIIGGKNSSNTKQLFTISREFCADSYLIENESELQEKWFVGKKLCGVSAGASTPDWIIQKIIANISKIDVQ